MGTRIDVIRAGQANMFLSPLFGEVFATVTGAKVELYNTDGSQGAARGAGVGAGIYHNFAEAFSGLQTQKTIEPNTKLTNCYQELYKRWATILQNQLNTGVV